MRATSTQSNVDTQALQRVHMLRQLAQHDRSVHDTYLQTGALSPVHTSNSVEATFDIVERIVRLASFDNVAWTVLLVWTGLYASRSLRK